LRYGNFLLAHFALVHIAVEEVRPAKPPFYPHANTDRQSFCNIKEVGVTSALRSAPLVDGFDGVGGGAPQEFRA
jgi:hypothetical protein